MLEKHISCSFCSQRVGFPSKELPCEVLNGWLTVSHWKGLGSVDRHHFCSFTCLKKWADAQALEIPKAFLEVFTEESGEGNV